MIPQDFTTTLLFSNTTQEVYEAINNVKDWWTENLEGGTHEVNDEFTVRFRDVHVSSQRITDLQPNNRIEWLVTYSKLNFVEQKDEWTNTTIVFEITDGPQTELRFTHHGLTPQTQCYGGCSKGWEQYINGSLNKLLSTGKGTPGKR